MLMMRTTLGIRARRWQWLAAALLWIPSALAPAPATAAFGPLPPANPATAANGAATMHGDSASSGSTPFPGPGTGPVSVQFAELGTACPSVLAGADRMPVALCTSILSRAPVVYLLDPSTGEPLASLNLPAGGNLFGGVYAYIDEDDRLVLVDANGDLLRIAHTIGANGAWSLDIVSSLSLAPALRAACGSDLCGGVVGLAPDWTGRVWFATTDGVAGIADPRTGSVRTVVLGRGEQVANSISTVPGETAIATDHALYLLTATSRGVPRITWRAAYDRGPYRKPGQLSHGTGATPVFFGPRTGTEYLAITDNAVPAEHLLVYNTRARSRRRPHRKVARLICDLPVLTPGPSGTENAPVGSGSSVFVASTYGYPYPAQPAGAEPTQPAPAPFTGGLERVDILAGEHGCKRVWQSTLRSAAVPRLSLADGLLYTTERTDPLQADGTSDLDEYYLAVLNAQTGRTLSTQLVGIGALYDTLQMAGTIMPGRVIYQGTLSGILRIAPADGRAASVSSALRRRQSFR